MLTIEHSRYVVECDLCGDTADLEHDFNESRAKLRELGWEARKAGIHWVHTCPDCKED